MFKIIVKKELKIFLRNPLTYIFLGLFTLVIGWIFFNYLNYFVQTVQVMPMKLRNQYDFTNEVILKLFGNVNFLLLFLAPLMTMKSFSEEFQRKTIIFYDSAGVSNTELVLAKLFSWWFQGLILVSTTLIFPLALGNINITETTFVISAYLGLILNMMCFFSLGLLGSSLSSQPFIAALFSFILVLFAWMINMFGHITSNFILSEVFKFLSINHHFENFVKGSFGFSDLSFYMSFICIIFFTLKKRMLIK